MRELAKRENVYCKVSGMATEADWNTWTPDDAAALFRCCPVRLRAEAAHVWL